MPSTESLLIGGVGVVAAFVLTQGGGAEQNTPPTTTPAPVASTQPPGESQETLRPEFRDFQPEIKAEIRELSDAIRERLPGANNPPLSPSALDFVIGQGDNVPFSRDEAFARPGDDPVEVVREHFRSEAIKSGRIPLEL